MADYTSDDGLKVLNYLNIKNLAHEEIEVFKREWDNNYSSSKDFVGAIWHLYSEVLPFTCGDVDTGSFSLQTLRDNNFSRRLKNSRLEEKLNQGVELNDILSEI